MTDRFSPVSLLKWSFQSARRHDLEDSDGMPPIDLIYVAVMVSLPVIVFAVMAGTQAVLTKPDQILGGLSLLVGALLGAFALLAGWRSSLGLDQRGSIAAARIDEAAGLCLNAVLASTLGAGCIMVLTNLPSDESEWHVLKVVLSALGTAAGAFVVVSLLVVVNRLWDAYADLHGLAPRRQSSRSEIPDSLNK